MLDLWEELSASEEVRSVEEFMARSGGGLGEHDSNEQRRRIGGSPPLLPEGDFTANLYAKYL